MGAFKNIVEPACIVGLFTAGALINSRSRRPIVSALDETVDDVVERYSDEPGNLAGWATPPPKAPKRSQSPSSMLVPRFDGHLLSRFLHRFPFLMEIWYWNLTYWVYQLARAYSATLIRGDTAVMATAIHHAKQILRLEQALGIAIEKPLQDLVLSRCPTLMSALAKVYYSHISIGVAFLVYIYTYLPYRRFSAVRRTLFADNWIAFFVFTVWRCAPPRLMVPAEEFGYIDVLHGGLEPGSGGSGTGGNAWTNNRFQLTIAAMPSLHFGTSLLLAASLWRFSPHRWLRAVCWLWPAMMLLTILATANHWVLDAVVGAGVVTLGWRVNRLVCRFQPLEDMMFRVMGVERPPPGESVEVLRKEATAREAYV